jgi:hypothetical protein
VTKVDGRKRIATHRSSASIPFEEYLTAEFDLVNPCRDTSRKGNMSQGHEVLYPLILELINPKQREVSQSFSNRFLSTECFFPLALQIADVFLPTSFSSPECVD